MTQPGTFDHSNAIRDDMQLALEALRASSPWLDVAYRWKDPEWQAQRAQAIEALEARLRTAENR